MYLRTTFYYNKINSITNYNLYQFLCVYVRKLKIIQIKIIVHIFIIKIVQYLTANKLTISNIKPL